MNLKKLKSKLLEEITKGKYQLIFQDYGGDVPYTEQYFGSEEEAEKWVRDQKSYSDNYDDVTYYNPQSDNYFDGYTIEEI
jgi:hypothetical protein